MLADSSIVNANARQNPDLFRALKGGSNNFGIVTRFDLYTYPQKELWGGFVAFPASTIPSQLAAFSTFMGLSTADGDAEVICAVGYVELYKMVIANIGMHYIKGTENPDIFKAFTAIQPQMKSSLRVGGNLDFVKEVEANQAVDPR